MQPIRKAGGGDRHSPDQSAHLFHVMLPALLEDGPGPEKEQTLEKGVVQAMIEGGDQGQGGNFQVVGGMKDHRQAKADIDNADILDAVIGEQALEIVLHQGVQHPQNR